MTWRFEPVRHSLASRGIKTKGRASQFTSSFDRDMVIHLLESSEWIKEVSIQRNYNYSLDVGSYAIDFKIKGGDEVFSSSLNYLPRSNKFDGRVRLPLISKGENGTIAEIIKDSNYDYHYVPLKETEEGVWEAEFVNYTHVAPHIIIESHKVEPKYLFDEMEYIQDIIGEVMEEYE